MFAQKFIETKSSAINYRQLQYCNAQMLRHHAAVSAGTNKSWRVADILWALYWRRDLHVRFSNKTQANDDVTILKVIIYTEYQLIYIK